MHISTPTNNSEKSSQEFEGLNDRLRQLLQHCQSFKGALTGRSIFQLVSTFLLFSFSLTVMILAVENYYWLTLVLTIPTAGFLVRLFIIQHDCGHQSFFKSRKTNDRIGRLLSIFTWTPYSYWRTSHNIHHANSGNLTKRGVGDLETLTVKEYLALSWRGRLSYRVYRHPVIMLVIGGPLQVIIFQRFPFGQPLPFKKIWKSVLGLNLSLLAVYSALIGLIGLKALLLTYLPVVCVTAIIGGWLFFVQHQFEDTDWSNGSDWDFNRSAVLGSSYYDLPKILHWFSGNIGFHHLHHLCGVIPNYRLRECHEAAPHLPELRKITLWQSLKCIPLSLWDEDIQQLVGFKHLKTLKQLG